MRIIDAVRSALLAAMFALGACGNPQASVAANAPKVAAGPAMWRVSDEDSTAYLFGTFHILPRDAKWITPAFEDAMRETGVTVTEVDAKSPAAQTEMTRLVQELGLNPPGVTLTALLGPTRAVRFSAIAERYGLKMSAFEPMKPWLAMISLSVAIMQKEGFDADSGAEEAVMERAAIEKDRITHLETAEYQIKALASLSEDEILADFDASLHEYEEFDVYSRRMLDAWITGDVERLDEETLSEIRRKAPGAYRILITERNANWAREIEEMMARDENYFIAVGAGHLIGAGSVVEMLKEKGYAVERVQ